MSCSTRRRTSTAAGGFAAVTDETLRRFTDRWTQRYIHDELNDFQEKIRALYLPLPPPVPAGAAGRDRHGARAAAGDFVPLDFELNFADPEQIAPITLSDGEVTLNMSGVADRVDGWLHDGKLYLRVVDYKTGRKAFSLSDVWYGMGLQMLLYLFALERSGPARYGLRDRAGRRALRPGARRAHPCRPPALAGGGGPESAPARCAAPACCSTTPPCCTRMEHSDTPQYLPVSPRRKTDGARKRGAARPARAAY